MLQALFPLVLAKQRSKAIKEFTLSTDSNELFRAQGKLQQIEKLTMLFNDITSAFAERS